MDKKFNPEKYRMMVCPVCEGYGRFSYSDDAQVCQNCGGFGFIRIEGKSFDQKDKPIASGGQQICEGIENDSGLLLQGLWGYLW